MLLKTRSKGSDFGSSVSVAIVAIILQSSIFDATNFAAKKFDVLFKFGHIEATHFSDFKFVYEVPMSESTRCQLWIHCQNLQEANFLSLDYRSLVACLSEFYNFRE